MQIKLELESTPQLPTKPQIHSHKHHNTYNGSRHLPIATRIKRSPAPRGFQHTNDDGCLQHLHHHRPRHCVYEVTLYYPRNRACTIYRSREDFVLLERGQTPWRGAVPLRSTGRLDVHDLHRFLSEALAKRPNECAVEYFLRRRMGDCGY
ncbi:hypothetical protein B0T16DRAFT_452803 [Cercophora newfieldiana]|uniref:Uncharacterized protein n=1 Tax=Cercophora newfieldiana TaxID=92897 RepID=A0AA39YTD9_9PEZI|nr:hypothetical protein B0T16DRAFT_452803 [Cercophora newfieldiana]